jgi:hypothetical protein
MSSFISKAIKTIYQLYLRAMQALTEERRHRTAIEQQLFYGRTKFSTKNDDDLPGIQ